MALPLDFAGEGPAGLVFAQVEVRYDGGEGIGELRILAPPGEEPAREKMAGEGPAETGNEKPAALLSWSVLFPVPCFPEMLPAGGPVEVRWGEEFHYVLFGGSWDRIAETWYDPWGNFTAYFETRIGPGGDPERPARVLSLEGKNYRGDYSYESGGNLSGYSGDQGFFSALYNAQGRPLYWTAGRNYALQWDEAGRLLGMRDLAPPGGFSGEEPAAFRCEYEFDSRGNWIRRRETALFLKENLLLPGRMRETVRQINYTGGD
jgi:YD repeat-containing protein